MILLCLCNPYAEPNAPRAPNCPIHGRQTRQPWTCSRCGATGVLVRPAAQDALTDLRQIEEMHAIAAPECARMELRMEA